MGAAPIPLDPRLAPLVSGDLDDIGCDAGSVMAMLGMAMLEPGLDRLAEHVRSDASLRAEALSLLPWLVEEGTEHFGNLNDVAVAVLVDALCRAGERPERLEAGIAGLHGLWWAPLVLDYHAA